MFRIKLHYIGLFCLSALSAMQSTGQLTGTTSLLTGNCMPGPNAENCKPTPMSAWVYVSAPSEKFDRAKVVDSVRSDAHGKFEIALSPGRYSLFVNYEGEMVCTRFECTPQCACHPVAIAQGITASADLVVNKASW